MGSRMIARIRTAGLLVGLGLAVQAVSALIVHPLAFVGFLAVGCPLLGAGVLYFLLGLVSGSLSDRAPR